MVKRFMDHAANERTFLAWVRTAVAIVGVGVVLSKIGAPGGANSKMTLDGVLLLAFGMLLILGSGIRFLLLRRLIRKDRDTDEMPLFLDVVLAIILLALIATLISFGSNLMGWA